MILDEKHMNAVTGLSGSGPAFMYIMVEALAEGGVKVGLPRDVATLLAAQTMMGAGSMVLETGEHPSLLKDAVTTPAGCTIDGILELEDGGLRVTLIKAVVKATQRAAELFRVAIGGSLDLRPPPQRPWIDRPPTPTPDRRVWSERLVRISGFRRFLPTRAIAAAVPVPRPLRDARDRPSPSPGRSGA